MPMEAATALFSIVFDSSPLVSWHVFPGHASCGVVPCARDLRSEMQEAEASSITLMRRREFLHISAAGLLAARMSGKVCWGPKPAQPTLGAEETGIFPIPFSAAMREGRFHIADDVIIVTPSDSSI